MHGVSWPGLRAVPSGVSTPRRPVVQARAAAAAAVALASHRAEAMADSLDGLAVQCTGTHSNPKLILPGMLGDQGFHYEKQSPRDAACGLAQPGH